MVTSLTSRFEKSGIYSKDAANLLESVSEMPQVLPALMNAMRSFKSIEPDRTPANYLNTGKLYGRHNTELFFKMKTIARISVEIKLTVWMAMTPLPRRLFKFFVGSL